MNPAKVLFGILSSICLALAASTFARDHEQGVRVAILTFLGFSTFLAYLDILLEKKNE